MKKILMITTGGTLACGESPAGLVPTLKGEDILDYAKEESQGVTPLDFRLIDSSVMTDRDREELARLIWKNRDGYDAFVVTHGTDSMAYTAAYLACALKNFDKSVVLAGSQLHLGRKGSDAPANLRLALKAAKGGYKGVCIAMANRLVPALTATKIDTEGFAAFESVTGEYIRGEIPAPDGEKALLMPAYKTALLYITPNISPEAIEKYRDFDRVLALVLGAGGMPKAREKAFAALRAKGVKVYIKSQCLYGKVEAIYEAHSGVGKYAAVNGCSVESAVYSLMFGRI